MRFCCSLNHSPTGVLHLCIVLCLFFMVVAFAFRADSSTKGAVDFSGYDMMYTASDVDYNLPCSDGPPYECTMRVPAEFTAAGGLAGTCLPGGGLTPVSFATCSIPRRMFATFLLKRAKCWESNSPQCNCLKGSLYRYTQRMAMTGDRLFAEGRACFYRQPPTLRRTSHVFDATLEHLFLTLTITMFICPLYTRFSMMKVYTRDGGMRELLAIIAAGMQVVPLFVSTGFTASAFNAPLIICLLSVVLSLAFDVMYHAPIDQMQKTRWQGIYPFSFFGVYSVCILLAHAQTGYANRNIITWHVLYGMAVACMYCAVIVKPSYTGTFRMQLMLFASVCVIEPVVFVPFGYIWTWLPAVFAISVVMTLFLAQDHQSPNDSNLLSVPVIVVGVVSSALMFFARAPTVASNYDSLTLNALDQFDNSTWANPATVQDSAFLY